MLNDIMKGLIYKGIYFINSNYIAYWKIEIRYRFINFKINFEIIELQLLSYIFIVLNI